MLEFRLIDASLQIEFEENEEGKFDSEFGISGNDIDEWVSFQKAKNSSDFTDPLTLKLIVGLYKKLDEIEKILLKSEELHLKYDKNISKIGYEGFKFKDKCLIKGQKYFGKLTLPFYVKKVVPIVFEAIDDETAKIDKILAKDEKEWSHFVAQSELLGIRKAKENE